MGAVLLSAISGLLLRLWILGNAPLNSDEATAGLVAHYALHGHTSALYWGQNYGGLEPYAAAALFVVVGQSPLALNVTPSLLALVAAILTWRIGLRVMQRGGAIAAAALTWAWAESTVWNSTHERGLHEATLVMGLIVLLEAVRIREESQKPERDSLVNWGVLGLASGLGWWSSPEIVYFLVPVSVFLVAVVIRHRFAAATSRFMVALVGAFVGALPWLYVTVSDQVHTLSAPSSPYGYGYRFRILTSHALPMILGLRIEGAGAWVGNRFLGVVCYAVILVLSAASLVYLAFKRPEARPLVLFVCLFPFLYAAIPTTWFWNDGRYGIFLTPVLALVWMGALWELLSGAAKWAASVILLAALASTLVSFNAGYQALSSWNTLTSWHSDPTTLIAGLSNELEAIGVKYVTAGYWVGNDLTFISNDQVTAFAVGEERNPPLSADEIAAAEREWLFPTSAGLASIASQVGSDTVNPANLDEASFTEWLTAHRIPFRIHHLGAFDLVSPSRTVQAGAIQGT